MRSKRIFLLTIIYSSQTGLDHFQHYLKYFEHSIIFFLDTNIFAREHDLYDTYSQVIVDICFMTWHMANFQKHFMCSR